jgi:hypothetical protein
MEDRSSQSQLGGGEDNAFQGAARTVLFFTEEAIETSHSHLEGTQEGSFKKARPSFGLEKDCVTFHHSVL